jgi:ribose 5-phosphate isomerase B
MKVAIAADHGGFELKEKIKRHLIDKGYEVQDFGAAKFNKEDDYPDFAAPAAKSVGEGANDVGILICSTGIGMSISANKVPRVRAALVMNEDFARMAKSHNNANVITLPGKGQIDNGEAFKIVDTFLGAEFDGGRHLRRVKKIEG